MAVRRAARAALAVTGAGALLLETELDSGRGRGVDAWTSMPRTVVEADDTEGCGRNITGYLLSGQGLFWSDCEHGTAKNLVDCKQKCDITRSCVGFTSRLTRRGRTQCSLYKGLVTKFDPRGMSYAKCGKGTKCPDSEGFNGFWFSHNGTWKNGIKVSFHSVQSCAKHCEKERSCVGFTSRHTKEGTAECIHFKNTANGNGPKRDMRANTYSKCAPLDKNADPAAPSLPLSLALLPKAKKTSCSRGYTLSSRGWWWQQYDRLSEAVDLQSCASQCDSLPKCVSFVYRPLKEKGECYQYKGMTAISNSSVLAYTKCGGGRLGKPCAANSQDENLKNFQFSHYGTWEGGTQILGVTSKSCSAICASDGGCSAMSWTSKGEVCSTFKFKSRVAPRLAAGAEGHSKCLDVDMNVTKTKRLI